MVDAIEPWEALLDFPRRPRLAPKARGTARTPTVPLKVTVVVESAPLNRHGLRPAPTSLDATSTPSADAEAPIPLDFIREEDQ